MILEQQKEANILSEGQSQESIGMSLDLDSAQMLMQMLSKNLYSDPIGSTVREWASNALDSHRRAGVDTPIIVKLAMNEQNNYEFSVEDFGLGLDDDDVKNIISKYGKSTKRDSSIELGMFGLGFKAGLAYSSAFYFVCRKNGMERKYMMYEGENGNTIDLLYETPTDKGNGVKMILPVKKYYEDTFITHIQKQLGYFENVYFDVKGIDNNFKIVRGDDFQWSELNKDGFMHICLDNVYYPLDYSKLGTSSPIKFPVGLRFGLSDGIYPTPNREAIRYTKETIDIINKKISKVSTHFIEKYNETIVDTDNVMAAIEYHLNDDRYIQSFNGVSKWDVNCLSTFSNTPITHPKIKGINLLSIPRLASMRDYIFAEYSVKYVYKSKKFYTNDRRSRDVYYGAVKSNPVKLISTPLHKTKKDYIKDLWKDDKALRYVIIIEKNRKIPLRSPRTTYGSYMGILELHKYPKSEWRERIVELQKVIDMWAKSLENLDDITVPLKWIEDRKPTPLTKSSEKSERRVKLQGEITVKLSQDLERYVAGNNCKFVPVVFQMNSGHRNPYVLVYGKEGDRSKMDKMYKLFGNQKVRFGIVSERQFEKLKELNLHNWISMEEFEKGKHIAFKRVVTAYLITVLKKKYHYTFKTIKSLSGVCDSLVEKLSKLDSYQRSNSGYTDEGVLESMLSVAEEHKLYDYSVYYLYIEVKNALDKLPFLEKIMRCSHLYPVQDYKDLLVDLFRYYKFKINYEHYKIVLNEDVPIQIADQKELEQFS